MHRRRRFSLRYVAGQGLFVVAALAAAAARGQEQPAATYDEWKLLEPAQELQDYKSSLRDGGFDAASKKFLVETALPQLALPKNRSGIDVVRRRMREVLCGDGGSDPKAAAAAMQAVAEFMTALARDGKADVVVRVNAALLVGELRGPGNKPWTPAVPALVAALGDNALPPAVRVAATAGLARHVDAEPEARSADVGPAALALVSAPLAGVDPAAADWLRSRALVMLARMGTAAPAGSVAAAAKVLADAARPIDVRVRAAAAVGACIKAAGDADVAAAAAQIRALAGAALAATKAADDRRELATRIAGAPAGIPPPGLPAAGGLMGEADGTVHAYRRDAWRLATLADALAPAAGAGGLAQVAGAAAAEVTDTAKALRESALLLDAQPDAGSLAAALEGLAAIGKPDAAEVAPATNKPAEPAGVDGVPFGGQ